MSPRQIFFDRTLVFLLGLILLGISTWGIGLHYDQPWAQTISAYSDQDFWSSLPQQPSYSFVLLGMGILLSLVGLWIILTHIRAIRLQESTDTSGLGTIRVRPQEVAAAVAESLSSTADIRSVRYRTILDAHHRVFEFQVNVPSSVDIPSINERCTQAAEDIKMAFPSEDYLPRFLLRIDKD